MAAVIKYNQRPFLYVTPSKDNCYKQQYSTTPKKLKALPASCRSF